MKKILWVSNLNPTNSQLNSWKGYLTELKDLDPNLQIKINNVDYRYEIEDIIDISLDLLNFFNSSDYDCISIQNEDPGVCMVFYNILKYNNVDIYQPLKSNNSEYFNMNWRKL